MPASTAFPRPRRIAAALLLTALTQLGACGTFDRLSSIGKAPPLTPVDQGYRAPAQPIALPMPPPDRSTFQANSLWRSGARGFFKDQRAAKVGDILTVQIDISDKASVDNTTTRSRTASDTAKIPAALGFEAPLSKILPNSVQPDPLVDLGSTTKTEGSGKVERNEDVTLTVAAIVTQVLPNGNLVIQGHQEVRVNYEVRDLNITGVVRPEDISNTNTIKHTQIAEARISYGGRGQLTDMQQPRYGQQVFDVIFPF